MMSFGVEGSLDVLEILRCRLVALVRCLLGDADGRG